MPKLTRSIAWRDDVIATRVHEARRGGVRLDGDDPAGYPAERVGAPHREHTRGGDDDVDHDTVAEAGQPADTAEAVEARSIFDALFALVTKDPTPPTPATDEPSTN